LRHADSSNEVRLRIKLSQGGDAHTLSQGMDGVAVEETTDQRTFGGNNLLNR
jgi:twitching motility protein PilU